MATNKQNFELYQGDTRLITIGILASQGGSAIVGTGSTHSWAMTDESGNVLIPKDSTVPNDFTLINLNGTDDAVQFALDYWETAGLTPGVYAHELEETDASGNVYTVTRGFVTVTEQLIDTDLTNAPVTTLVGTVKESDGTVVEGATVQIVGTSIETTTNQFGAYTLTDIVPLGWQTVYAVKSGVGSGSFGPIWFKNHPGYQVNVTFG
jgi:hypothetical protein